MGDSRQPKVGSIRRNRSGCWNCKARRRRCTEDRPSCSWCVKRGVDCYYGIKILWQDDAESMGIAFGRVGMKDRFRRIKTNPANSRYFLLPISPRARYHWLNTTFDDVEAFYEEGSTRQQSCRSITFRDRGTHYSDTIPPTIDLHPKLDKDDRYLFHYFSDVCTLRRSLVDHDNPWRTVLLPLCYESQGLLHIAMAWAAHNLRNHHRDLNCLSYDDMILRHKCQSLKYLQDTMYSIAKSTLVLSSQARSERDALLLLVMLQCVLEVASGSLMEWTFHMKGALEIMKFFSRSNVSRRDVFSPQVLELVYGFFSENDTFLATTGNGKARDMYDELRWSTQAQSIFPFIGRLPRKIRPCMGVSSELLDIISSITSLVHRRCESKNDVQILQTEFLDLQRRIHLLKMQEDRNHLSGLVDLHAAAFEEATWIYLYHANQGRFRQTDIIQDLHLPRLLAILEKIHVLQGPLLGFLPYPMWPLFMASCSVQNEDRTKILEWFTVLKNNKPISNVPPTMAAVEAIWKRKDLESDKLCSVSSAYCLNWAVPISKLGWKMSLI